MERGVGGGGVGVGVGVVDGGQKAEEEEAEAVDVGDLSRSLPARLRPPSRQSPAKNLQRALIVRSTSNVALHKSWNASKRPLSQLARCQPSPCRTALGGGSCSCYSKRPESRSRSVFPPSIRPPSIGVFGGDWQWYQWGHRRCFSLSYEYSKLSLL